MTRAEILAACLELPLTDGERAVMRNIAIHDQSQKLPILGAAYRGHEAEVWRVLSKCRDLIRAQHPHL